MVELPDGVLVVKVSDDDVPIVVVPEDGFFESACADPAGYPVIATGTADFLLHDSDGLGSRTRAAAFGAQLHGTVTDDDGALYRLTASVRLRVTPDDDFRLLRSDVSLVPR